MKQPEDKKTLELSLDAAKRGRGRPAKPDALTPAQRAKKYRDAKRAAGETESIKRNVTKNDATPVEETQIIQSLRNQLAMANAERDGAMKEYDRLKSALIAQQMKFDLEHHKLIEAQTRIANLEAAAARPKTNPLNAEVRRLKAELVRRDKQHDELMRATRDEYDALATSRK